MKHMIYSIIIGNIVTACYKILALLIHEVLEQADQPTEVDWEKNIWRTETFFQFSNLDIPDKLKHTKQ